MRRDKRSRNPDVNCECESTKGSAISENASQIRITPDENGWFRAIKRPTPIYVKKMDRDFFVQTLEGKMIGRKGDYVGIGPQGEKFIIRERIFELQYRTID